MIVGELDDAKAKRAKWEAREPELKKGWIARSLEVGFEDRHAAWLKVDQQLEKRIAKLEKKHDQQWKLSTNYMRVTEREVIAEMEKEDPARAAEVAAARDREQARTTAEGWNRTREQLAERRLGKGHDQGHGIGD